MPAYKSQYQQDKFCYENFFREKKDGIFVDIGAEDGVFLSNSYFFEKELGWKGLCVEARQNTFMKLIDNRNCWCEKAAVSDKEEDIEFLELIGPWTGALSGIYNKYDPRHLQRIERDKKHPGHHDSKMVKMKTKLLSNLLDKYSITHIDFLSIDIEGGEIDILKSLDMNKYSIDVITIEDNYGDLEIDNFMKKHNFRHVTNLGCDKVYSRL